VIWNLPCHGPARIGSTHDVFEPLDIVMFSKMIGQAMQSASLSQSHCPSLRLEGSGQVHSCGGVIGLNPCPKNHCGSLSPRGVTRSSG
jgi:hypothetical protein